MAKGINKGLDNMADTLDVLESSVDVVIQEFKFL